MRRKISILLIFVIAVILILPQGIFAASNTDHTLSDYRWEFDPPGIVIWGGPEAVSDTSIKAS